MNADASAKRHTIDLPGPCGEGILRIDIGRFRPWSGRPGRHDVDVPDTRNPDARGKVSGSGHLPAPEAVTTTTAPPQRGRAGSPDPSRRYCRTPTSCRVAVLAGSSTSTYTAADTGTVTARVSTAISAV